MAKCVNAITAVAPVLWFIFRVVFLRAGKTLVYFPGDTRNDPFQAWPKVLWSLRLLLQNKPAFMSSSLIDRKINQPS